MCETFQSLLEFLYTGTTSVECVADNFSVSRCMDLIEVANRLCQPLLVAHFESVVVDTLSVAADSCKDLTDVVLSLLEPAQVIVLSLIQVDCSHFHVSFECFCSGLFSSSSPS